MFFSFVFVFLFLGSVGACKKALELGQAYAEWATAVEVDAVRRAGDTCSVQAAERLIGSRQHCTRFNWNAPIRQVSSARGTQVLISPPHWSPVYGTRFKSWRSACSAERGVLVKRQVTSC